MTERPQDVFNGTWNEVEKINIDALLQKMGYNWAIRKVANVMGMTLVLRGLIVQSSASLSLEV